MLKKQFKYMPCAKRSLLCHGLYHNGYLNIICPKFKESENCDTFQFWHFPILTLSNSDTFRFWHFPILTLSDPDTFQFWNFPISFKMGKNWILTLSNLQYEPIIYFRGFFYYISYFHHLDLFFGRIGINTLRLLLALSFSFFAFFFFFSCLPPSRSPFLPGRCVIDGLEILDSN